MGTITIPYKPRPQFQPYHANEKRFSVSVCHRRAGKTVARINRLIRAAAKHTRAFPPGRYAYIAPFRNQAKRLAWLYLQHYAGPIIVQMGAKKNEADLILTMPHNGATVELYGADNAEAMRGNYFDGVVLDEAQAIARSILASVILPCLSDYKGWLDCSGTPRGWQNLLGELVKQARADPANWYLQVMRASESGILDVEELRVQRANMSENEYAQEFECSFDAAITGAVYGKEIAAAQAAGRIGYVPHEPDAPVHTAWDLGYDDATAIWWFQALRGEYRLLEYYESNGQDIPHYCGVLADRAQRGGYSYGRHYVPHDAGHKLLAAGGRSIVQQAHALGVRMTVVPATSQQNGIEAARKVLATSWFDETGCEQGLEGLRQYQFEFDADKKVFKSKPRHDWASHPADAFEIIGQVGRAPREVEPTPVPRFLDQMTFNELAGTTRTERERI